MGADVVSKNVPMEKLLLEVIFASEKRKEVLLLLQDGARGIEDILDSVGTTRTSLLPQMKILEKRLCRKPLLSNDLSFLEYFKMCSMILLLYTELS